MPPPDRFNSTSAIGAAIDRNRPILENADGSFSTERTITAQSPRDGLWYNIPTIIYGKPYEPGQVQEWFERGESIPTVGSFKTLDEAERAAVARSQEIGRVREPDRQKPLVNGLNPYAPR